jgi:hypothetical protein
VTASEFAFLALGLVLGVASGAAIAEVLRSRPASPREVRVTVTAGSVPRRASTLSSSAFTESSEPEMSGPADRGAIEGGGSSSPLALPASTRMSAALGGQRSVGIAIRPETPRVHAMRDALRTAEARAAAVLDSAPRPATSAAAVAGSQAQTPATEPGRRASATAVADGPRAGPEKGEPAGDPDGVGRSSVADAATGPCADARRVADERCALATAARERAGSAAAKLREAQRAYDEHHERADDAAEASDPVRVRAAKDAAQRAFHAARDRAHTHAELEAAARDWLSEINAINAESRGAADLVAQERAAAAELVTVLERLAVEADAARIGAESAEEACVASREALAECEEAAARPPLGEPHGPSTEPPAAPGPDRPASVPRWDDGDDELAAAAAVGDPLILALLRGDRPALARAASEIAAGDASAEQTWTLQLGRLVEAVVDRAIEAAALDFPTDHPFWGPFSRAQCRDVAGALASLGFRFDGLGGWVDDRVPSQRDLSLAVGYAGLDPMRVRRWPNDAEASELYADVRVAADEYLAEAAGGLTLGELVSLLGRRADALADVWNAWGRVRPVLLEPSA